MSLIGRLEEQRELQRYVESPEAEFVVVYGPECTTGVSRMVCGVTACL